MSAGHSLTSLFIVIRTVKWAVNCCSREFKHTSCWIFFLRIKIRIISNSFKLVYCIYSNAVVFFSCVFQTNPPYAACILFELYKSDDNFYIQLFYKDTIGVDKVPLQAFNIPTCGIKCDLDQFFSIYKDSLPTADFDTMCRLPSDNDN